MAEPQPRMTEEEEERLLDELLDVLDLVTSTSGCADMVPLWLEATKRPRAVHFRPASSPTLAVPPHIRAWGRSMRSKYAALAAWRHAVLAERILEAIGSAAAAAVQAMYFTPVEANEPPYSWSKASSRHPMAREWPSANVFDDQARRGCRDSVAPEPVNKNETRRVHIL
jgi:hypothetical protein